MAAFQTQTKHPIGRSLACPIVAADSFPHPAPGYRRPITPHHLTAAREGSVQCYRAPGQGRVVRSGDLHGDELVGVVATSARRRVFDAVQMIGDRLVRPGGDDADPGDRDRGVGGLDERRLLRNQPPAGAVAVTGTGVQRSLTPKQAETAMAPGTPERSSCTASRLTKPTAGQATVRYP